MNKVYIGCAAGLVALGVLAASSAPAVDGAVLSREPAADAPQGVKAMQPLMGDWRCRSSSQQEDGSWKKRDFDHAWKWYYILGGRAVQDFWLPASESKGVPGTNVRMFDPEAGSWFIAWSNLNMRAFDLISATHEAGEMILTGHKNATASVPEHERRITFHNISDEHFDWKYEARGMAEGARWKEMSRLSCDRAG